MIRSTVYTLMTLGCELQLNFRILTLHNFMLWQRAINLHETWAVTWSLPSEIIAYPLYQLQLIKVLWIILIDALIVPDCRWLLKYVLHYYCIVFRDLVELEPGSQEKTSDLMNLFNPSWNLILMGNVTGNVQFGPIWITVGWFFQFWGNVIVWEPAKLVWLSFNGVNLSILLSIVWG